MNSSQKWRRLLYRIAAAAPISAMLFWACGDDPAGPIAECDISDLSALSGSKLQDCDLRGADLTDANIRGGLLRGANLAGAVLAKQAE